MENEKGILSLAESMESTMDKSNLSVIGDIDKTMKSDGVYIYSFVAESVNPLMLECSSDLLFRCENNKLSWLQMDKISRFCVSRTKDDGELFDSIADFLANPPKGSHLIATDQWKEDFLNQINPNADLRAFILKGEHFNIFGLPFFNTEKQLKRQNFELQFGEVTGVETTNRM